MSKRSESFGINRAKSTARTEAPASLPRCAAYAWSAFWHTWWGTATTYTRWCRVWNGKPGHGYGTLRWYAYPVNMLVLAPLFAFNQAYAGWFAHERGWPWIVWEIGERIERRVSDWVEARATWYSWLAPDSGIPGEIGFHARTDLLPRDADGHIDYAKRPRIFNQSVAGSSGTASQIAPTATSR